MSSLNLSESTPPDQAKRLLINHTSSPQHTRMRWMKSQYLVALLGIIVFFLNVLHNQRNLIFPVETQLCADVSQKNYWNSSNAFNQSRSSIVPFAYHRMDDRMFPTLLELLPAETSHLPVLDQANNLVSGGGVCSYPILRDNRKVGRCCLGATSGGGEQSIQDKNNPCQQNSTVYLQVQKDAMEHMKSYPVHFDKHDPQKHTGAEIRCDVCRLVQIVASMKHKRFAIVGDSVQSQVFAALECELIRRNFNVTNGVVRRWPEEKAKLPPNRASWKYGVTKETCINVAVPNWMKDSNQQQGNDDERLSEVSSHVEFCYYSHYRPYPDTAQHKAIAESSDFVMINYGLHFLRSDVVEYRQSYELLLEAFSNSDCLLLYRETSAQHFDSNGGEFEGRKKSAEKDICVPHNGTSDLLNWRTKMFKDVANSLNVSIVDTFQNPSHHKNTSGHDAKKEVAIIPFYDWTAKLLSMKRKNQDCTHFCHTPHIYYPMWRHIRIALDTQDRS